MDGNCPGLQWPGPVGRTARSRIRPFPLCIIALSRMLLAYIHRSITHRVHFLDNARSHLWGSFICAKNLLIEATWRPSHMGPTRMPSATTRPIVSVGPPAANGTTIVIGRVGNVCALAVCDTGRTAAAPAKCRN